MQCAFSRSESLSVDTIRAVRASAVAAARRAAHHRARGPRVTDLRGIKLENGNALCRAPREAELVRLAQACWLSIYDRELARATKS